MDVPQRTADAIVPPPRKVPSIFKSRSFATPAGPPILGLTELPKKAVKEPTAKPCDWVRDQFKRTAPDDPLDDRLDCKHCHKKGMSSKNISHNKIHLLNIKACKFLKSDQAKILSLSEKEIASALAPVEAAEGASPMLCWLAH